MTIELERWEPVGTTLVGSLRLMGLIDDAEGFRVLLQDTKQPWFVYGIYGRVIYYQRNNALRDCSYPGSPLPASCQNLLFQIHSSRLLAWLRDFGDIESMGNFALEHYVVCFPDEQRIDLVSDGPTVIRLAGWTF